MNSTIVFLITAVGFGVGLAMDAFSVSAVHGLHDPYMKHSRMCLIAGTFGTFQIAMPLIGWLCVRTVADIFESFQCFIPWIALILLLYIGGKMLLEGIRGEEAEEEEPTVNGRDLFLQGVATSIDALSVGFTIADFSPLSAITESLIIGIVTFLICIGGVQIGKKFGTRLSGKASILGGVILILIGIEIFIRG